MKVAILTLTFFLFSLSAAIPVREVTKRALSSSPPSPPRTPSPPPSRPETPTAYNDAKVPLPGRSGIHTHEYTKDGVSHSIATFQYGDDKLHDHMYHLQKNQEDNPSNRNPMKLAASPDKNRAAALRGIKAAGVHPVSGEKRVKDEKMAAMLHNPHHSTSTTVQYLPMYESSESIGTQFM